MACFSFGSWEFNDGCWCVRAVVPGLPVIGNLLQLKEKKPYQTFTRWAEEYGPIYSIRTGASTMVVLNTTQVAKEVLFFYLFFFPADLLIQVAKEAFGLKVFVGLMF